MANKLELIELGYSELTDTVYLGIKNKSRNKWLTKKEVNNSFLDCVINKWEGKKEVVSCGSHSWEISVKKIKG